MRLLRTSAGLIPAILLVSCTEHLTDPEDAWYAVNDAASFRIERTTTVSFADTTIRDEASLYFSDIDSIGIDGGNVRIDGVSVPPTRDNSTTSGSGVLSYRLRSDSTTPLFFDIPLHRFSATGSGKIAAITDSIATPAPMMPTAPSQADTVSRANGFTITWNTPRSGSASVRLVLVGLGDLATVVDHVVTKDLPDIGSYTVRPEMIRDFPAGRVGITLSRSQSLTRPMAGGKHYSLEAVSTVTILTNLAP